MLIRAMRKDDIPKIEAIYASSPLKYDIPMLDSPVLLSALVMVDENDEPRVMLAAEQVAEMVLVMDHSWQTPAFRAIALKELHSAVVPVLEVKGIRAAYAFLGPDVPKGYQKRLHAMGANLMNWVCLKWNAQAHNRGGS